MQIVSFGDNCMKCQILFSAKNISKYSSAENFTQSAKRYSPLLSLLKTYFTNFDFEL